MREKKQNKMTKPQLEIGQEVTIKRALGPDNGRGKNSYYYGWTLVELPLGTKATVVERPRKDIILLEFRGSKIRRGIVYVNPRIYLHPNELFTAEEKETIDKYQNERFSSMLDNVLLSNQLPDNNNELPAGQRAFEPKFNAREEFALWVRQEFPELDRHVAGKTKYDTLLARKEEVIGAARKAYEHAMQTTRTCVSHAFDVRFRELKESDFLFLGPETPRGYNLGTKLLSFVDLIEGVSSSLNEYSQRS